MPLSVGDKLPTEVKFTYIPYTEEKADVTACGMPIAYNAGKGMHISFLYISSSTPCANRIPSTEWQDKKVVLFSVPGAFTPGCSAKHLPGYIENLSKLKSKGVDIVACIAFNDAWVMSAWGKANGIKGDDIVSSKPPSLSLQHKLSADFCSSSSQTTRDSQRIQLVG